MALHRTEVLASPYLPVTLSLKVAPLLFSRLSQEMFSQTASGEPASLFLWLHFPGDLRVLERSTGDV